MSWSGMVFALKGKAWVAFYDRSLSVESMGASGRRIVHETPDGCWRRRVCMEQIGRVSATAVALKAPGRFHSGQRRGGGVLRAAADRASTLPMERKFRVALCVPMGGSDGIWGPSCLASARLAEAELNRFDGIAGRSCELVPIDASNAAVGIEQTLTDLVDDGEVDALVGMHISSVRQRIVGAVGGRIPYVYTCLYEGGETTPGVYAIGETAHYYYRMGHRPDSATLDRIGREAVAMAKRSIGLATREK